MKKLVTNEVYLHEFVLMWKKYKLEVDKLLELFNTQYYISSDDSTSFMKHNVIYAKEEAHQIKVSFICEKVSDARGHIMSVIAGVERIIKQTMSLKTINGYEDMDENKFISGVLDKDGVFYLCLKGSLVEHDNLFECNLYLKDDFLKVTESIYESHLCLNDNLYPHYLGMMILNGDKEGVMNKAKEVQSLLEHRDLIKASPSLSLKGQYDYLREEGISLVVIINKKDGLQGIAKVKEFSNDNDEYVDFDKLNSFIDKKKKMQQDELYAHSLREYYELTHNGIFGLSKKNSVCCKKHLEDIAKREYFILRPFSNRCSSKKCSFCEDDAKEEILLLKKNY